MRDLFPGYYRPTDEQFDRLWEDGVFVFDASVLLNLYRYTEDTTAEFLELLDALNGRIWLPHQAALEYQSNRPRVIFKLEDTYASVRSEIEKAAERLRDDLKGILQEGRHPRLNRGELEAAVEQALAEITAQIEEREEEHPDLLWNDPIRDRIDALFGGRVGEPFDGDTVDEIRDEGEDRYEREVPPGYMDKDKDDPARYGDLILWKQVLGYADEHEAPVVLVTNDQKEDWWREVRGRTIGPRPELVEEIQDEAEVLFHLYTPDDFLRYARERLAQEVEQDAIDEVRETREEDQAQLRDRKIAANLGFGKALDWPSSGPFQEALKRAGLLGEGLPAPGSTVQVPDFTSGEMKAKFVPEGMEEVVQSIADQQRYYADLLNETTLDLPEVREDLGLSDLKGVAEAIETEEDRAQRMRELSALIEREEAEEEDGGQGEGEDGED